MGNHPLNLTLRFALEIVAVVAIGSWGWTQYTGVLQAVLAFGLPLLVMAVWGTFRVPNDPGAAPVAVAGIFRLAIEFAVFGLATGLLYATGRHTLALVFGAIVVLHYVASYDRVQWLLTIRSR